MNSPDGNIKRIREKPNTKEHNKEKTPAQKEILRFAIQYLKERMESLGVVFRGVNEGHFIFLDSFSFIQTEEYIPENYVTIQANAEANLGTIIHGALHYLSSEYYIHGVEQVEQALSNSRREVRSGFHGIFFKEPDDDNPRPYTATFQKLNEAVTEKIAREIIAQHPEAQEILKPLFAGRKEDRLKAIQDAWDKKKKELEAETENKLLKIRQEEEKSLSEVIRQARGSRGDDAEISAYEVAQREQIEGMIEMMRELHNSFTKSYESLYSDLLETTESGYSFTIERDSYAYEIEVLETILEGLAIMEAKEKSIPIETAKDICWKEMQVAYLTGNVMHLRKIDRFFGAGTLRELNNLAPSEDNKELFLQSLKDRLTHS